MKKSLSRILLLFLIIICLGSLFANPNRDNKEGFQNDCGYTKQQVDDSAKKCRKDENSTGKTGDGLACSEEQQQALCTDYAKWTWPAKTQHCNSNLVLTKEEQEAKKTCDELTCMKLRKCNEQS